MNLPPLGEIQSLSREGPIVHLRHSGVHTTRHDLFEKWLAQVNGSVVAVGTNEITFDSETTAMLFMIAFPDLGGMPDGTYLDGTSTTVWAGGQVRIKLGVL